MRAALAALTVPLLLGTAVGCGGLDAPLVDIDGKPGALKDHRGKALLVVNVASECGYTPQYAELQQLFEKYRERGLVVLGFPSNEFGGQEPGDAAQIKAFAEKEYGVTFPLFQKLSTNGDGAHPLYKALTTTKGMEGPVKWNFEKFLIDPNGKVVGRFGSKDTPLSPAVTTAIERVLPE